MRVQAFYRVIRKNVMEKASHVGGLNGAPTYYVAGAGRSAPLAQIGGSDERVFWTER